MHYALHVTVAWVALWIVQDGENAAKATINPDVLTTFARNVGSVLSPVLLGDSQASRTNRSSSSHVEPSRKSSYREPSKTTEDSSRAAGNSRIETGDPPSHDEGNKRGDRSSNTSSGRHFQGAYVKTRKPGNPRLSDKRNSRVRKPCDAPSNVDQPCDGPSNRRQPVQPDEANVAVKRTADDVRKRTDNAVNADSGGVSVNQLNRYRLPDFEHYKPDFIHASPTPYGPFDLQRRDPHYHRGFDDYSNVDRDVGRDTDESDKSTTTHADVPRHRFRYHDGYGPFSSFYGRFGPYGDGGGIGSIDRPFGSENGGLENSSIGTGDGLVERSRFEGFYRNPVARRPYYGYRSFEPNSFYRPYSPSYPSDSTSQSGSEVKDNTTDDGTFRYPNFRDYGFNPYGNVGRYFGPSFYTRPKVDSQEQENSTSTNQGEVHGHSLFRPHYGAFHSQGYPSSFGTQYDHFRNVFHHGLDGRPKDFVYRNFYPEPLPHFPHSFPYPPFGGFFPGHNNIYQYGRASTNRVKDDKSGSQERPEVPLEKVVDSETELTSEAKTRRQLVSSIALDKKVDYH